MIVHSHIRESMCIYVTCSGGDGEDAPAHGIMCRRLATEAVRSVCHGHGTDHNELVEGQHQHILRRALVALRSDGIDEVGRVPIAEIVAEYPFQGDRRSCREVVLTTSLPFSEWNKVVARLLSGLTLLAAARAAGNRPCHTSAFSSGFAVFKSKRLL